MEHLEKEVEILQLLKKNILEFLDELIEQFEEEGDIIVMRFFMSEQISLELLMSKFIKLIYPYKEKIKTKDESFFLEHESIFGFFSQDKVFHFKQLYLRMSEENRDTLWSWFSCFISICEKYIKLKSL